MPASDAQIIANRRNAALSTGPTSAEGKERSRRNALKHGLAATVVVPEEQAGEVALRVAMLQESLAPDDDGFALILAERAGYLSMRLKRCYVHEEAMIARRVRDAQADYDDERCTAAEHVLSYIANEPPTGSRQLRSTPEGVDILIGWLEEIRGEVDSRWGEYHCFKYDEATGRRSQGPTSSRVRGLTDLITRGDPGKLPPGEVDAIPEEERRAWALARSPARSTPSWGGSTPTAARSTTPGSTPTAPRRAGAPSRRTTRRRRWRGSTRTPRRWPSTGRSSSSPPTAASSAGRRPRSGPRPAPDRPRLRRRGPRTPRDGPDPLLAPRAGAGLGSFVPRTNFARGPIDASNFTIGKASPSPLVSPKPPRYTP